MQCPMNRVEVLEYNLDKVQNGKSHFLIYARDIPRYIKACYEKIGIARHCAGAASSHSSVKSHREKQL